MFKKPVESEARKGRIERAKPQKRLCSRGRKGGSSCVANKWQNMCYYIAWFVFFLCKAGRKLIFIYRQGKTQSFRTNVD